jgi:hypothetical protein
MIAATDGIRSIALIEACYQQRRTWELPWLRPDRVFASEAQNG